MKRQHLAEPDGVAPTELRPATQSYNSQLEADATRLSRQASLELDAVQRTELGQFFTPWDIAAFMASMPILEREAITILDPGAGTGMLSAAVVARLCSASKR